MYIAAGQAQTTPVETKFWSQQKPRHFGHLLQVLNKKKLLESLDFIHFFHEFIHVYSPGAGADNPLGTKYWCQQEHLVTSVMCCKLKKISLKSRFYTFFHDFIHVYSSRAGADSPQWTKLWCQHTWLVICCKFKKNVFEVWFYKKNHDLIIYIAPGQGQTAPRGRNVDVNRKALSLYPFVASFKEVSLKSDFIHFLFMI